MSIENTYQNTLIEEYIKEKLTEGESLSALELIEEAQNINETLDLTKPQFSLDTCEVVEGEEASASKFNKTFEVFKKDLGVAYRELKSLTENSLNMFERWKLEAENIEKELKDMEEEIENLLLLTQDTEGYHSILLDNFTDLLSVDLSKTTARVNIETSSASLRPNTDSTTKIFLNEIDTNNITFRVQTGIVSRSDLSGASIGNIFSDSSQVWHTILLTEKAKPVICELIVKLGEESINFNRIELLLHDSGSSGTMTVTPLYSEDDLTYFQLPCLDYSQEINTAGNFYCSNISAKYIKFILAKSAPDPSASEEFRYQFGFKNISLFDESFDSGASGKQSVESKWLHSVDREGEIQQFEKLVLESCESVASNTAINFYVAATSEDPLTDPTPLWYPITPTNRDSDGFEILYPKIFEIGSVANKIINDITLYNETDSNAKYSYMDENGVLQNSTLPNENELYSYLNMDSDGILNYFLYNETNTNDNKFPVNINDSSLVVYRGVDVWKFEEPFYYSIVEVKNASGTTLQTGDQRISIDDGAEEAGEVTIPYGTHSVRIHKNYYSLEEQSLKTIVEGKVDFLAARKMKRVSVFDMLNNVSSTDYDKFALDSSLPGKQESNDKTVKKVFVIKKGGENEFVIKFNMIDQLKKYVKVKVELETNDPSKTPSCDGYQIKIA